jgi:hypothetical protein
MRWTVKRKSNKKYEILKNGQLLQDDVSEQNLESAMNPHHVRGSHWDDLRRQLKNGDEGTVTVDPWPPGDFRA